MRAKRHSRPYLRRSAGRWSHDGTTGERTAGSLLAALQEVQALATWLERRQELERDVFTRGGPAPLGGVIGDPIKAKSSPSYALAGRISMTRLISSIPGRLSLCGFGHPPGLGNPRSDPDCAG